MQDIYVFYSLKLYFQLTKKPIGFDILLFI